LNKYKLNKIWAKSKSCIIKSIRSFTAMGKYSQTSHDACLDGTSKQFAI